MRQHLSGLWVPHRRAGIDLESKEASRTWAGRGCRRSFRERELCEQESEGKSRSFVWNTRKGELWDGFVEVRSRWPG